MSKKSRASSTEVQVIETSSESRPRTLIVPPGMSLYKESKVALESLKGMVLENQKVLFEKCFDLVEELISSSHKVKSELTIVLLLFMYICIF